MTTPKPSPTAQAASPALARPAPALNAIEVGDVVEALGQGLRDFAAAPRFGLAFGLFYAAIGWGLVYLLLTLEISFYVYPMATGFAFLAPFVAAGLYEVSRRLETDMPIAWADVLRSVRTAGGKDLSWMVLVTVFSYIIWLDIAFAIYVVFYGLKPIGAVDLLSAAVTTPRGFLFFLVGNSAGLVLGLAVFSVTALSFPLLFDRHVDFVTAMIASVKAVLANPAAMLAWAAIIALLLAVSLVSLFVALIVVLPVLGHATWHLYRRAIASEAAKR